MLDRYAYDPDLGGAALLARALARLLTEDLRVQILAAIEPGNASPLILDPMLGSNARCFEPQSPAATELAFHAFQ